MVDKLKSYLHTLKYLLLTNYLTFPDHRQNVADRVRGEACATGAIGVNPRPKSAHQAAYET